MLRSISLALLSAVLLIVAYPQLDLWKLAWVALVPLFFAIEGRSYRSTFGVGFLFAYLFFFGTLGWLIYVTYPGALLLCAYLALYPALFALGFIYFKKLPVGPRLLVLASLWTVLEYVRSHLFSGFGWVLLGYSQYKNLWLIQIADIVGVYGISFLVMLVNLVIYETIKVALTRDRKKILEMRHVSMIIFSILFAFLIYGSWLLKTERFTSSVKVAVVQPNIPQKIKWDEKHLPFIIDQTLQLTEQAAMTHPDMIVWPETSLPGILSEHPSFQQRIQLKAMDLHTPIVIGSILENLGRYYNSAILIGDDGVVWGHYNKIHLVPFGEYLPLRPLLGWINHYIGLEDFTSGKEYTIFTVAQKKFGVLICFEDTLSYVASNFTKAGAEFLVNMTNDAWFMDTKEPFLHMAQSVFQAVQNRRSLVRAANTGVSGFIDPLGQIVNLAQDDSGKKTFVSATSTSEIPLNNQLTFYTKYADVFTLLSFFCILWGVLTTRRIYGKENIVS